MMQKIHPMNTKAGQYLFTEEPNHIHGIIKIVKTNNERENVTGRGDVETQYFASLAPPTKTSELGHHYYTDRNKIMDDKYRSSSRNRKSAAITRCQYCHSAKIIAERWRNLIIFF
ncbi:MAG: hypothetical protein WCS73_03755 [Lentisphaeria bacterium]